MSKLKNAVCMAMWHVRAKFGWVQWKLKSLFIPPKPLSPMVIPPYPNGNIGVNVYYTNWHPTQSTSRIPQYELDIAYLWSDSNGIQREDQLSCKFPDDLQHVSSEWLEDEIKRLLLAVARERLGVDG